MNKYFKVSCFQVIMLMTLFCATISWAKSGDQAAPFASQRIIGPDRILDSSNVDTQTDVRVVTAKNGWIFTAYIRANGTTDAGIKIKRSKNNGESWKNVCNVTYMNERFVSGLDLIVCGNDSADLVLYLMSADHNLTTGKYTLFIKKFDANTGALLANSYTEPMAYLYPVIDCAIATDFLSPSLSSSPYSIAAVFSFRSNPHDSLVYLYSLDGGNSFNRMPVDTTDKYFGRVSIAYGRSLSQPNGKYFLAYTKKEGINTKIGSIRTCHNTLNPASSFTTPFEVDKLIGSTRGVCSFPSISCQMNNLDNDSNDLTTIIMLERDFNGQGFNHDVLGFVSKNSNGNSWNRFNVMNGSASNAKQPHVIFDHLNNSFLVTYWDSTTGKLPMTFAGINFNPNTYTWPNLLEQYNDVTANIEDAKPRVSMNPSTGRTNFVWISGGVNVEGVAYFDTNVSLVGVKDVKEENVLIQTIPNPADESTGLNFYSDQSEGVKITICDLSGRAIAVINHPHLPQGWNKVVLNTSDLAEGCYLLQLSTAKKHISNKLIISHH